VGFDAGMIARQNDVGGENQRQQPKERGRHGATRSRSRKSERDRGEGNPGVIGISLLEAEIARGEAERLNEPGPGDCGEREPANRQRVGRRLLVKMISEKRRQRKFPS
jgi:hypothetical protein